MTQQELKNTAKQLLLCMSYNRNHRQPFDLHICNANFDGVIMSALRKRLPNLTEAKFPVPVHSDGLLEMFPKECLVYMTPHCNEDLHEYNPNDIYVIGGIVDKHHHQPVSLIKAKELGLRMARLPLDRYLQWGNGGGKSLTLDQMVAILMDLKNTGDWNEALKHVPLRKIVQKE